MKVCPRCKIEKPRSEFAPAPPSRKGRDGLKPYCRPCMLERGKENNKKNWKSLEDVQHDTAHFQAQESKRRRALKKQPPHKE